MNKYLSDKLRIISLLLMIMVVFLHSYNLSVHFISTNITFENGYNTFIQNFISKGITYISVPLFFLISGYLFFLKINGRIDEFIQKMGKRTKTLLIPYLLWSAWGLFFYFVLQQMPMSKNFFTHELIINYSFKQLLDTLFLNPIPYQLWFIRDLFILVILSPIIYKLIKSFKTTLIILLFINWFFPAFSFYIVTNISIVFFSLGAYFAITKSDILLKTQFLKYDWIVTLLWVSFVLLKTLLIQYGFDQQAVIEMIGDVGVVFGIISVWMLYDRFMTGKLKPNNTIYHLSLFSFFIFTSHEPILTIVKKGLFSIAGTTEIISLVVYFITPLITIFISVSMGYILKRFTPKLYSLVTGAR